MINLSNGEVTLKKDIVIRPGDTKEGVYERLIGEKMLVESTRRTQYKNGIFILKPLDINGFDISIQIHATEYDYINKITFTKSDFYTWPNWPQNVGVEKYAIDIKKYNNEFLKAETGLSIYEDEEVYREYSWGALFSTASLEKTPVVMIALKYNIYPYLQSLQIDKDEMEFYKQLY